jgi:hypothetical protein
MALIELAVYLQEVRRGNAVMARAQSRFDRPADARQPAAARDDAQGAECLAALDARHAAARGVDDKIDNMVTDIALEMGSDIFKAEQRPFWAEEKIWTTRAASRSATPSCASCARRSCPANAEAIAKARRVRRLVRRTPNGNRRSRSSAN